MDITSFLTSAFAVLLLSLLSLAVYRLWLSPVAHIPGPLLARLTYWYEFYWDVIQVGRYTFHIKDLHDQYGPIIRINPHEVHIIDPDFYDELYVSGSSGRKRQKWAYMVDAFGIPDSTFATVDHDLHRIRRNALNQFFSKTKVRALQKLVDDTIGRLLGRLQESRDTDEALPLGLAFTALASDITGSYAFDVPSHRINEPDFGPDFHRASDKAAKQGHLMKQFPWMLSLSQKVPDSWLTSMDPDLGAFIGLQRYCQRTTKTIQTAYHSPDYKPPSRHTIFHEILASSHLPEPQKHHDRLWQDAETVVIAGTVTTATTLSTLSYFLLSEPAMLSTLRDELFNVISENQFDAPLSITTLETLPYLTACIMEALRYSNGVSTRLQRIDPENPIVFHARTDNHHAPARHDKTYVIPSGTPVSMTTMLIHNNPLVFSDPFSFRPDRWLENGVLHHKLDRYFLPFSKGTRMCLGMNLAWMELYLVVARVFGRGGYGSGEVRSEGHTGWLELSDSSFERDVEIVGDGTTPIVREPMKGIKVKVWGCRKEKL